MGLVERLMHELPDEEQHREMAVHTFFAAMTEWNAGQLTRAQLINYYQMDAADIADLDALVALRPSNNEAGVANYLNRIHAVFVLAEVRAPSYDTPANVRTRLGI